MVKTIDERRVAICKFCSQYTDCRDCPINDEPSCIFHALPDEEIDRIYSRLIPKQTDTTEAHDPVNRPSHYTDGKIETIEFIEDKQLGFCLGNAVKYISRAGKKDPSKEVEDLHKAIWYLKRRIYELTGVTDD